MSGSQRTTTSAPAKPPLFEPPESHVDERALLAQLELEINAQNFSTLLSANFLVALDGHDRKLKREFYEDVLALTFNFQNRLTRIAQLGRMVDIVEEGGDIKEHLKEEAVKHFKQAVIHQERIQKVLKLYSEMRGPEDPVS